MPSFFLFIAFIYKFIKPDHVFHLLPFFVALVLDFKINSLAKKLAQFFVLFLIVGIYS